MNRWETVTDPELLAWLSSDSKETEELIVEADLPKRTVAFAKRAGRFVENPRQLFFQHSLLSHDSSPSLKGNGCSAGSIPAHNIPPRPSTG